MKYNKKQAETLLRRILAEDAEAVDDEETEFDLEEAIAKIDANREQFMRPRIEEEVSKRTNGQATAKMANMMIRELKKLTGKDFDPAKRWEENLAEAAEHLKLLSNSDTKELQEKYMELTRQSEEALNAERENGNKRYSELEAKYIERDAVDYISGLFRDKPITGDKTVAAKDFYRHLKEEYAPKYNAEDKSLSLYNKNNPELQVMNAKGTDWAKLEDVAKDYFSVRGNWATDTRQQQPTPLGQSSPNKPAPFGAPIDDRMKAESEKIAAYLSE